MKFNIAVIFLLIGLTLTQGLPSNKKEKLDGSNVNLEDAEGDNDRFKKSILCLDTKNTAGTVGLLPQSQPVNIQSGGLQALSIQPVARPVQTLNIQAVAKPMQTFSIQPSAQSAAQSLQAFSVQPAGQSLQTFNTQPAAQPLQTISIQPAAQSLQAFNIQPAPQTLQTFNTQPAVQPLQTFNIQPAAAPVQTLNCQAAAQPVQTFSIQAIPQVSVIQTQPAQIVPQVIVATDNGPTADTYDAGTLNTNNGDGQTDSGSKPSSVVESFSKVEEVVKPSGQASKLVVSKMEKEKYIDGGSMMPCNLHHEDVPIYAEQVVAPMPKPYMVMPQPEMMASFVSPHRPSCHQCQQPILHCRCKPRGITAMRSADMMMDQPMHYFGFRERAMVDTL